jgi:hypothetical protein
MRNWHRTVMATAGCSQLQEILSRNKQTIDPYTNIGERAANIFACWQ